MRPAGAIGGSIARSIEDRISYSRVIARDEDLYGKRSRHWSTADPIQFLVVLLAACLALTICGLACDPPPPSPDDPPFDAAGVIAKVTSLRGLYLVTWIPLLFYSVIGAAVTAVIAHQSARLLVNVVMAASWTVIVLCLVACEIVDIAFLAVSGRRVIFDQDPSGVMEAILNSRTRKGSKLSFLAKDEFLVLRSSFEGLR